MNPAKGRFVESFGGGLDITRFEFLQRKKQIYPGARTILTNAGTSNPVYNKEINDWLTFVNGGMIVRLRPNQVSFCVASSTATSSDHRLV